MILTKRTLLRSLTRDELAHILGRYGLRVRDRRVKRQLVEAISSSELVDVPGILERLPLERLRQLCQAFDLAGSA